MPPTLCDLVFEGGGAKGAVFLGALQELERQGLQTRRLVGTSAGAISATLLAAGYTTAQLGKVVQERTEEGQPRFATFLDPPAAFPDAVVQGSELYEIFRKVSVVEALRAGHVPLPGFLVDLDDRAREGTVHQLLRLPAFRSLFSFVERGGLYEGRTFLEWLREKLDAASPGWGSSTLGSFQEDTGRDLTLVASDTTGNEMLVLNHRTAPQCPTAWAVRMSMSIPFLWQEIVWPSEWGNYRGRDLTGHCIVDGGVLSNFPLQLLTSQDPSNAQVMGNVNPREARILGLLIDETIPVPGSGTSGGAVVASADQGLVRRLKTVKRVRRLVDTLTEAHDKEVIEGHKPLVCRLPAQGYGTTEFDMSEARMNALIEAGRNALADYFRRQEGPEGG